MPPQSASVLKNTLGQFRQRADTPELPSAGSRCGSELVPGPGLPPSAGPSSRAGLNPDNAGPHRSVAVCFLITTNDGLASVTVNGVAHPLAGGELQGFSPIGDLHGAFHSPEVVQTAPGVYTFTLTYTLAPSHVPAPGQGSDADPTVPLAVSATENSGAVTDTIHTAISLANGVPTAVPIAEDRAEADMSRNENAICGVLDGGRTAGPGSAEEAAERGAGGLMPALEEGHEPFSGAGASAEGDQDASFRGGAGSGGMPASRFSYINQNGQAVWKEIPQPRPGNPNPSVTVSDLRGGGSLTIHRDGTYHFIAAQQPATVASISAVAGVQFGAALSAHWYAFPLVADNVGAELEGSSAAGVNDAGPHASAAVDILAEESVAVLDEGPAGGRGEKREEVDMPRLDLAYEDKDAADSAPAALRPEHDQPGFDMGGNAGGRQPPAPQESLPPPNEACAAGEGDGNESAVAGIPAEDPAGYGVEQSGDDAERPADAFGLGFDMGCGMRFGLCRDGDFDGGLDDEDVFDGGTELIFAGAGDEILHGWAGPDVFIWRVGEAGGGNDTILDFTLYEDKLNFGSLFGSDPQGEISEADILLALQGGMIDLTADDATHLNISVQTGGWSQQVGLNLAGSALNADQLDAFHHSLQAGIDGEAEKAALLHLLLTNLGG